MNRGHKLAIWPALVWAGACGPAQVTAPKAKDAAASTTSPEAVTPTSAVEPETEVPNPLPGATGIVGSPTTVDEGRGVMQSVPAPSTTVAFAPTSEVGKPTSQQATASASWYGSESGSTTANGEHFDPDGLTFAHLSMPFGTRVRFCGPLGCVVARCTDRGPAAWTNRIFDLSRGAFAALAPLSRGVVDVTWAVVA